MTSRLSLIVGTVNPVCPGIVYVTRSMIAGTTRMNPGMDVDRTGSVE